MNLRAAALLPLGLFAAMGVVLIYALSNDPHVMPSTLLEKPLPQFDLPPLDPAQSNLQSASLKGNGITLVNVWGSWCGSCRYEHPLLLRLAKDKRFTLVGIDWKDSKPNADHYLATYGNPYSAIGMDESGRTAIDLGVSGAPETFIVDKNGTVRLRIPGPLTPEIFAKDIEPIIKEQRPAS